MSLTSPDAKAVVRALDALSTQVRRIADALMTPVVDTDDATQTPPTTTGEDAFDTLTAVPAPAPVTVHIHGQQPLTGTWHGGGMGTPRGSSELVWEPTITFPRRRPPMDPVHILGIDPSTPEGVAAQQAPAANALLAACRVMETRTCPESYNGPYGDRPCARFESDDPAPWTDPPATPAADEDAQRATDEEQTLRLLRRESLLVLLTRLQRGRTLSEAEAGTLRQHVEAEIREADTARSVARSNLRHVKTIVPELETADRIRAEVQRDRDQHAAVLAEVLATFVHKVPGYRIPRVRSGDVDVVTLDKWRSVIAPTVERPWWETVAEMRAELEQAQTRAEQADAVTAETKRLLERRTKTLRERAERAEAAIERVRHTAALIEAGAPWTANQHETAGRILDALDGTEQPTTEA